MRRTQWPIPDELQLGWCAIAHPPSTRCSFDADPAAPGAARNFVRCFLDGDARSEDVALVVSELATNAFRHAQSAFIVTLTLDPRLRIEVHDESDVLPAPRTAAQDAVTRRGLEFVQAVASAWGSQLAPGGGKVVWAEFEQR